MNARDANQDFYNTIFRQKRLFCLQFTSFSLLGTKHILSNILWKRQDWLFLVLILPTWLSFHSSTIVLFTVNFVSFQDQIKMHPLNQTRKHCWLLQPQVLLGHLPLPHFPWSQPPMLNMDLGMLLELHDEKSVSGNYFTAATPVKLKTAVTNNCKGDFMF